MQTYSCCFLSFTLKILIISLIDFSLIKIERILRVATEEEKQDFSYLLSKQAYHSMSEGHLWFSIFSRPPSNKFTRVQRCTCCFVLFILSMFLNIMYYDLKKSTNTKGLSLGPLLISPEQVYSI